jgi:hypothetical protein
VGIVNAFRGEIIADKTFRRLRDVWFKYGRHMGFRGEETAASLDVRIHLPARCIGQGIKPLAQGRPGGDGVPDLVRPSVRQGTHASPTHGFWSRSFNRDRHTIAL